MERELIGKANEIVSEIERLEKEICEFPVTNVLRKYKFKARRWNYSGFEIELTKDDIKALIDLRLKEVKRLEKELEELW